MIGLGIMLPKRRALNVLDHWMHTPKSRIPFDGEAAIEQESLREVKTAVGLQWNHVTVTSELAR